MRAGDRPFLPRWPGWQHLPRDTRDTLFLLAVIAWTALPHLLRLPAWCAAMTAGTLLWRARLALVGAPLPGRRVLAAVLLVAAALTQWSFGSVLGREPGVALLMVLMALKTLELRARRDAFVIFFLGFFLVLTHFLYSQSLPVAVAMLGSVWGLLTALVLAHMPVGRPSLRTAADVASRTALLGAPVMVLLFVMFPRVGPLWGVPQDTRAATGLSDSLYMGSVAEIAQDDRIALRVRFPDGAPRPEALYFRGAVMSRFDGNEWKPQSTDFPAPQPGAELRLDGPALRYEVTLEPTRLPWLPMLDATPELPAIDGLSTRRRDDLSWATNRPVTERLRIAATAYPGYVLGPLEPDPALQALRRLPPGFNPRLLAWAGEFGRRPDLAGADASRQAAAVLAHIRTAGYSYTLAPGLYGDTDPLGALDEFWLDRKRGFCEHFASAFVVVMRALGVPARIVTGYQGADPDPVDGYHLVRQSNAHAWAEYWQEGRGWVRADPTAAVAPDRVERGNRLLPPPGALAGALGTVSPRLLAQLRGLWEAVDNRWNQWVLNYARGQQLDLLERLGVHSPSWQDLARLLAGAIGALGLAGAAWAAWDRRRQDPWRRQSLAVAKALRRVGLPAHPHEAPRSLAAQVRQRHGHAGAAVAGLLEELDLRRYGRHAEARPSRGWLARLRREVRRLG